MKKKCLVIEEESLTKFEEKMNKYLDDGYEIFASSCNSRMYKAILVIKEESLHD